MSATGLQPSSLRPRSIAMRRAIDRGVKVAASLAAMVGLVALAWILCVVMARGAGALNWAFFTQLPKPPGESGGGLANAIGGTLAMTALAALVSVPLGMLAGVYLAEYGKASWLAHSIRFAANVLMGTPSILIGVFAYALLVIGVFHHSNGYAGAAALGIIILPIVVRTTEDMLQLVPDALRESALALGAPRWKVTLDIVFRSARSGLLTGVILAVARVSGESAPLLFTAMNNAFWTTSLSQPTANLTVTIFTYANSPDEHWKQMAWGASLLITAGILLLMLVSRFMFRGRSQSW